MDPLPHQKRLARELKDPETPGQIAYWGVGSGKTFGAINAAQQANLPLLAVVPAALRNNFRKEIDQAGFKGPSQVVSYEEAVKRLKGDPAFSRYAQKALVAQDEAQLLSQPGTQRNQLLTMPARKRLFLTGTPARNDPSELSGMLNALGGPQLPTDPSGFAKRFIETRKVQPGLWARLRGVKPGEEQVATNLGEFRQALKGKVDYQPGGTDDFPTVNEKVIPVPLSPTQRALYRAVLGKDQDLEYKIRNQIPPSRADLQRFQAFATGPRQIVNTAAPFDLKALPEDSPKIQRAAQEVEDHLKANPGYRGVSYSNFLEAGANPLVQELRRRGISTELFSGGASDQERKRIIDQYNQGKIRQLVLTGAGAQGLDLKGTRLLQLLEPYWNQARPDQVQGRAVRYQSHAGLPEVDRNVEVQRFQAVDRDEPSWLGRMFGRGPVDHPTIDQYLEGMARRKQHLMDQFLAELKRAPR